MLKAKSFSKKTRTGAVVQVRQEHYLRDDIGCGFADCRSCSAGPQPLRVDVTLLPDTNCLLHQLDIFEHPAIKNVVICKTVLDEVKHRSMVAYNRVRTLISDAERRFYVYANEHSRPTYIEQEKGESINDRNDRAIRVCTKWYNEHLHSVFPTAEDARVIMLTNDAGNLAKGREMGLPCSTVQEFVRNFAEAPDLIDRLAHPWDESKNLVEQGDLTEQFIEHLPVSELQAGIKTGRYYQGVFRGSRENSAEGFVNTRGALDRAVFVRHADMNRAIDGDIVAVELYPQSQWAAPSGLIERHDEARLLIEGGKLEEDAVAVQDANVYPTGRVVGVIRRRTRQYCGVLLPPADKSSQRVLFAPKEKTIPNVRIETRQLETLLGQQIVVAIDSWPLKSKFPVGHYVRSLGPIGDVNTETDVVLLEHDVPYEPFSRAVLDCLPAADWKVADQDLSRRRDLRHVEICSIDPPGCTDIDDALHLRVLENGNYEVGVHIADVTHFVRAGTAMDDEAAKRCTTVYLSNRRIDMLPTLLSSNLCSIQGGQERFALSCIFEMRPDDASVVKSEFCKSVIRSRAAMMYSEAQLVIDDTKDQSSLAKSLRALNALAKKLKASRVKQGALLLASTEVRFSLDSETHDPVDVQSKELLETNSLVEEFMLLANVTAAALIYKHFPQCAVLRRHPEPPASNFEPLIKAAEAVGLTLTTASSKELADSLDHANVPGKPYLNTLLRILATRCMVPAAYFCSGTYTPAEFRHYGLASEIYTHFTSPIRRYADVLVHRLIAACIGAESTYPALVDKDKIASVCDRMNHRHRMAQYASRASLELHSCMFFQNHVVQRDAYVTAVRRNAINVLVPHYGLEGPVYFDRSLTGAEPAKLKYNADHMRLTVTTGSVSHTFAMFDTVTVQISVDNSDAQRRCIRLNLVVPELPGFSVPVDPKLAPTLNPKQPAAASAATTLQSSSSAAAAQLDLPSAASSATKSKKREKKARRKAGLSQAQQEVQNQDDPRAKRPKDSQEVDDSEADD